MALRIRRGTDLERIGVVFVEGELVYSTDTKRLYIGDGVTAGGVSVSDLINDTSPQLGADIDLNGQDIVGFGNINIDGDISATGTLTIPTIITDVTGSIFGDDSQPLVDGANSKLVLDNNVLNDISDVSITNPASGEFLSWNGASWINSSNIGDVTANVTGNHIGSVYKDINTIVLNVDNGKLFGDVVGSVTGFLTGDVTGNVTGNVIGDVTGDVTGNVIGDVVGDLVGSVYAPDGSTLIVNSDTGTFYGNLIGDVVGFDNTLIIDHTAKKINIQDLILKDSPAPSLNIERQDNAIQFGGSSERIGSIEFSSNSALDGGTIYSSIIIAVQNKLMIGHGYNNNSVGTDFLTIESGKLHIGSNLQPTERLEVEGNTKIIGFTQFGSYTTVERDDLTTTNSPQYVGNFGMVIYNTDTNTFQGWQNTGGTTPEWVNLS